MGNLSDNEYTILDLINQDIKTIHRNNMIVFRNSFDDLLLNNGYIFKDSKYIRVIPGHGVIVICFKTTRRTLYDLNTSVISFSEEDDDLRNAILLHNVSISGFRRLDMQERFENRSINGFVQTTRTIFEKIVFQHLKNIQESNGILHYYTDLVDKIFGNNLHFAFTKIAAGIQSNNLEYVRQIIGDLEKSLISMRNKVISEQGPSLDFRIGKIDDLMNKVIRIKTLIYDPQQSKLKDYIESRNRYWDTIFKKKYPVFYKH